MRWLLRECEQGGCELSWARLWAIEFSSWQLRRNTEVHLPPKIPLIGHKGQPCLVLASLGIMQTFPLPHSPSKWCIPVWYWAHLEHYPGRVPFTARLGLPSIVETKTMGTSMSDGPGPWQLSPSCLAYSLSRGSWSVAHGHMAILRQ